ncbi:MAG TPA: ATP-binding cassette domain-containing protein, partial [Ktedonobacteraceae bacterium]|nr:ATP-binding cassette domain-containing protein [Ktedonobacteraceae bacterium]
TLPHQLPSGLETMLGTDLHNGPDLSGGQWQRLAFARARFRERALILLDEPTAALDALQEARLYEQFMTMARGHTTLIVSHRLPIARLADRIIVLDQGKIVEQGSHDQLMRIEDGYYRKMFQSQSTMYYQ